MEVKRLFKYLLVTLVSIMAFIGVSYAKDPKELHYGNVDKLMENDSTHKDVSCEVTSGDIGASPYTLSKVTAGGTDYGSYFQLAYNRAVVGEGTITIRCSYVNPTTDAEGGQDFIYTYGATTDIVGVAEFGLDYDKQKSIDLYRQLGMTKFISLDLNDKDGVLTSNCSESKCVVSINPGYSQLRNITINGKVVFESKVDGINVSVTDTILIRVSPGAGVKLSLDGPGTCEALSSDWAPAGFGLYMTTKLGNVSVPNCTPKNTYPLVEFKGWVAIDNTDSSTWQSKQTINTCTAYNPQLNTINVSNTGVTYFPCYASSGGIVVNGNGNTVKVSASDGWVQFGTNGSYYKMSSGSIVLPQVEIGGYFTDRKEAVGWYNQSTGETYQAGDSVPSDGSTYVFQTKTLTVYRNYHKAIYVNEPYLLKPSGVNVIGCSVQEEYEDVIETTGSGECILYGKQAHKEIEVTVSGENDYKKIFYVSVISRNDRSEAGDQPFIINISPNVLASLSDSGTLNSYIIDTCNDFKLSSYNQTGHVDGGGSQVLGYTFQDCNGSTTQYNSYCIDAGRMGPTASGMSYIRAETIGMNTDFGKLVTQMGRMDMYTDNPNDVADVTTLIRIVGIADHISIASDYNINDKQHGASYESYLTIAEDIYDDHGKIVESKVNARTEDFMNSRVKEVLNKYQDVEDTKAAGFERQIDDIQYGTIEENGDYTVTFKGRMYVPGEIQSFDNPTSSEIQVLSKNVSKSATTDPEREVYDFDITIKANIYNLHLPSTATKQTTPVLEQSKQYCFRLVIKDSQGLDAFMMEPEGTAASDGFQRMLTVNAEDLAIYVYFPPSPSVTACGAVKALNWEDSQFNESLFRTTGCCNMPALPDEVETTYCSNWCITTTLTSICDYRTPDLFEAHPDTSDLYLVNEGVRKINGTETFKIGTDASREECIVKTENYGWNNPGMVLNDVYNKTDDAGNSIMVDTYRNNLYCRVSCSEDWQLSMQSFGNFVGSNAVAAGSYFQINDQDMYISGKRTCYTTFINYGDLEGTKEGFTKDVNIQDDILIDSYNHYSNLSHVYADLACQNDKEYSTIGKHTAVCSYSEIRLDARKFCYQYTTIPYCLTDSGKAFGGCGFEVPAAEEFYCNGDEWFDPNTKLKCHHYYTRDAQEYCAEWYHGECAYSSRSGTVEEDEDGNEYCKSDNYVEVYDEEDDDFLGCYREAWEISPAVCDEGDIDTTPTNTYHKTCIHPYPSHRWYTCETSYYADDPTKMALYYGDRDPYNNLWTPGSALGFELSRYGLHTLEEQDWGEAHAEEDIGVTLQSNEGRSSFYTCKYSYPMLKYNKCAENGYGICVNYYMSTSNASYGTGKKGIDDGDETPDGDQTGEGDYVKYKIITEDGQINTYQKPVADIEQYYKVYSSSFGTGRGLTTGYTDTDALTGYAYQNELQASVEFANDNGTEVGLNTERYAEFYDLYTKYKITDDPEAFCHGGSWEVIPEESISFTSGDLTYSAKEDVASGATNVIITGVDIEEECDPKKMPNCATKKDNAGGYGYIYTRGNYQPTRFNDLHARSLQIIYDDEGNMMIKPQKPPSGPGGGAQITQHTKDEIAITTSTNTTACSVGDSCDTDRGEELRKGFLDGMTIVDKMDAYGKKMVNANANINTYARDIYACQHFELYNATDGENNDRNNNQLWTSPFMGYLRPFVKIVSSFDPEISYSYDEKEYMTMLGNNNVMERFNDLNDQVYGCYTIANNSGTHDCYNNATNKKKETEIFYYKNGSNERSSKTVELARNYTENYYYDTKNVAWDNGSDAAISYGEIGDAGTVLKLTCPESGDKDCNIGEQLPTPSGTEDANNNKFKRTILCTIGMVMDEPTLATHSDGKASSSSLVYLPDKDHFWTAGTCYVNQVQYLRANYVKASIENSSFYKNKGYWYVNTANDTKANGLNLIDALNNSNNFIHSTYDTTNEEQLGKWSILGSYNVFPIKLTTPRDLYQYTYTFANIGSYGDGSIGRVMGRDQSLIVMNSRTCFYEVFEELCLCCGNPIYAHVDSDAPYVFTSSTSIPYEMSNPPTDERPPTSSLAITTSNVSLSDMTSDNNRELGDNWTDSATFFYNGDVFTTQKGAELLSKIEVPGENIYSDEPEYKFTLNPEGLSNIREYNDSHTYGVTYEDLVSIGRYAVNPYYDDTFLECGIDGEVTDCSWEVEMTTDEEYYPQNRIINFTHYGSNFLMSEIKDMRGITFSGKYSDYGEVGMDESCYVLGENVPGGGNVESALDNRAESCRWVDYLEYDNNVKRYFRLSYK